MTTLVKAYRAEDTATGADVTLRVVVCGEHYHVAKVVIERCETLEEAEETVGDIIAASFALGVTREWNDCTDELASDLGE